MPAPQHISEVLQEIVRKHFRVLHPQPAALTPPGWREVETSVEDTPAGEPMADEKPERWDGMA